MKHPEFQNGESKKHPSIIVSMAVRYIHRPKTSGYGAHKSLQDLHKIMQNRQSNVAESVLWRDLGEESSNTRVALNNAINIVKSNIDIMDDNLRYKGKQGSKLVTGGVHKTGNLIYETGAMGSHALKSGYETVVDKGSHGVHAIKDSVHKVDTFVKDKGLETTQMMKDTAETICEKTVGATEAVKDSVQRTNEYIHQKGADGKHMVKEGYHAVQDKGMKGKHAVKEQIQKVDEFVHHTGAQGAYLVKHGVSKVDETAKKAATHTSNLAKEASYAVYQTGVDGSHAIKENVHKAGDLVRQSSAEVDEKARRAAHQTSRLAKDATHIVHQKTVDGAHAIKENVHKVGDFVRDSSAEIDEKTRRGVKHTSRVAKDATHIVHQKTVDGAHAIKENVHKVGDFVRESSAEIDEKTRRGVENTLKLAADAPHIVYQTGRDGAHLIKEGAHKIDEKAKRGASKTSKLAKDATHSVYQKGVEGSHAIKENVHKIGDVVRQSSEEGSQIVKENISKVDDAVRRSGKYGAKLLTDGLDMVQEGIHLTNHVLCTTNPIESNYGRQSRYLETEFDHNEKYVNGSSSNETSIRTSKSYPEGVKSEGDEIKPKFLTTNDDDSAVTTNPLDPSLVAPLAEEESLTITNGFHSLASAGTGDSLFKIKPEDATKYVKEHSVKSNVIDVIKQPPDPPSPKIQLSLKYNLTNMTLSVVVHKIRNLQETSVTWLPSARVVTRVIEMSGISRFRRVANTKRKTKTQRHNVSPIFEETLEYFLPVGDVKRRRLEVSVYHDSRFPGRFIGRNVVLGRCLVRNLYFILNLFNPKLYR